jgi:hypothetical protein
LATIVATTLSGKAIVYLDGTVAREVTITPVFEEYPGCWSVEIDGGSGFEKGAWAPRTSVRAGSAFEAVRRAAGAVLLVYQEEDG